VPGRFNFRRIASKHERVADRFVFRDVATRLWEVRRVAVLVLIGLLVSSCGGSGDESAQIAELERRIAELEDEQSSPTDQPGEESVGDDEVSDSPLLQLEQAESEWDELTQSLGSLAVVSGVALVGDQLRAASFASEVDNWSPVTIWAFDGRWDAEDKVLWGDSYFSNVTGLVLQDFTGDSSGELVVSFCPNGCFGTIHRFVEGGWVLSADEEGLQVIDGRLVSSEKEICNPYCDEFTTTLFEIVWDGENFTRIGTGEVAATPAVTCDRYIQRDNPPYSLCDKADGVWFLQRALIFFDYLDGEPDGYFGPKTDRAVRAAQRDAQVPVNGIAEGRWFANLLETYREINDYMDYVDPPPPAPARPPITTAPSRVVSTYCEVRTTGLTSSTRGTQYVVTTWRQWSDGQRDIGGTYFTWSYGPPSC
jgi:hypothetical protein